MLNKISQAQMDKYYMILLIGGAYHGYIYTARKLWLAGAGVEASGLYLLGIRVTIWDDEKVLRKNSSDDCKTLWMYLMPLNYTFLKS
jgi:hypothetical protein